MGYSINFLDNELVTAEYLNRIASELGGGDLGFREDMTYGVDDLNNISKDLVSKGVSRGCSLSVADGSVYIAEGVLFMADGRKVTIDEEGIRLNFMPGQKNYVWFEHDVLTGFVTPRCTIEEPEGADYVSLGYLTEEGVVEGHPLCAVMKNNLLGLNGFERFSKNFEWDGTTEKKLLLEIQLSKAGYQHVIVCSSGNSDGGLLYNACCGFVNLSDLKAFSSVTTTVYGRDEEAGFVDENGEGKVLIGKCLKTSVDNRYYDVYLQFEIVENGLLRVYQSSVNTNRSGYNWTPATTLQITVC